MQILQKKISELVTENYVYASVLHYFGIQFYNFSEYTLEEICHQKGLESRQLIKSLEEAGTEQTNLSEIRNYSIDLIIHYLKRSHYIFVKKKLPYMAKLVEDLSIEKINNPTLVKDLKTLFPLFVEDFIHHIFEEEETLFRYIEALLMASQGDYHTGDLFYKMEKNSIQYFALDHHTHDDEMRGIRDITNNYELGENPSLHLKVIFAEFQSLEHDLQIHAKIEDEILFIKAIQLEKLVKEMIKQKTCLN